MLPIAKNQKAVPQQRPAPRRKGVVTTESIPFRRF